MKTQLVGTIYATPEQLAKADAFADKQRAKDETAAAALFQSHEKRVVGGETRYYSDATHYATYRGGRVRKFEVRADGDYAVK